MEICAISKKNYIFASLLLVIIIVLGVIGQYIYAQYEKYKDQFIRTPAQNDFGIFLIFTMYCKTQNFDLILKIAYQDILIFSQNIYAK